MKTTSPVPFKRIVAAAAIALALPLAAVAAPGERGPQRGACGAMGMHAGFAHPGMGGAMPRYLQRLDLTEAQRDRIFDIMHAQAPILRNNMKALHKARSDLRALVAAPDFNEAKAKELAAAAAAATGEMTLNRAKSERQVYDVLTPEQRQKLAEMKSERPRPRGDGQRRPDGKMDRPLRGA